MTFLSYKEEARQARWIFLCTFVFMVGFLIGFLLHDKIVESPFGRTVWKSFFLPDSTNKTSTPSH